LMGAERKRAGAAGAACGKISGPRTAPTGGDQAMTCPAAFKLVYASFMEESRGNPAGPKADAYKKACQKYPAVMAIAHCAVAREVTKAPGT
jgi:hypothetical protein